MVEVLSPDLKFGYTIMAIYILVQGQSTDSRLWISEHEALFNKSTKRI
jgi:hypothetical protein